MTVFRGATYFVNRLDGYGFRRGQRFAADPCLGIPVPPIIEPACYFLCKQSDIYMYIPKVSLEE